MHNALDLFEFGRLRAVWYDMHGLLKAVTQRPDKPRRPARKTAFAAKIIATAAITFATTTTAIASAPPGQLSFAWPTEPTAELTRQELLQSVRNLRKLPEDWDGKNAPKPIERSISAAEYILPQMPDMIADTQAGLTGEGNVFLRFARGEKIAFLTVEPRAMHLVYMEPGQPNVYIDDAPFSGKVIPTSIKKVLGGLLRS